MKFKKLFIFLTVLVTSFALVQPAIVTSQNAVEVSVTSTNYIEGVDSSILLLSDHDEKEHGGLNSVFGSAYQLLNEAQFSILIVNYVYDNPTILEILNRKAAEGIEVTVVYDRERGKNLPAQLHPTITKLTRSKGDGHLHHKMIVVDHQLNWVSSANFNSPRDKNLTIVSRDPEMAEVLYQEIYCIGSLQSRQKPEPYTTTIDGQRLELYLLPFNDVASSMPVETAMNLLGKQKLLELISEAKSHIRVSMVVWTFKDSARALVQAAKRGVKVEIVGANLDNEVLKILIQGSISIKRVQNAPFHHKWMLIDNHILWNGSANWSMNAFSRTDDSVTILYDLKPEQVLLMETAWQELLKISR